MKKPALTGYTFNPTTKVLDFSSTSGFTIQGLLVVIHEATGKTLYAKGKPQFAPKTLAGAVITLNDFVDTTGMAAGDALYVLREDGQDVATDGRLESLRRGSTATSDTSGTLSAGVNAAPAALAANTNRSFIEITNTGPNPLAYRWGGAASALNGHILGPGLTARYLAKVPVGALNMFSTAGTTYFVSVG